MKTTATKSPSSSSSSPPRYLRVTKTLRPHQPGTLKLTRRYGEALVCVRYREDALGRQRCTTVELVIDESPVQARPSARLLVWVEIPARAGKLREHAVAMGAKWDPANDCWRMSMRTAKALQLQDQIRFAQRKVGMLRTYP
jgi:hypothetical protein